MNNECRIGEMYLTARPDVRRQYNVSHNLTLNPQQSDAIILTLHYILQLELVNRTACITITVFKK